MSITSQPDLDFDFISSHRSQGYQAIIQKYVKQFTKELNRVQHACQTAKRSMPRLDLLEVMCSEQSELTKQVTRLGGKAQRFGKVQGDLKTPEGRCRLFNILVTQKPHHLWYSPECGPWCQWSNMNMGKSIATCEAILAKRHDQLWQIALGIVLFRHQQWIHAHFDMEQPRGSALWKTPGMSEIRENTLWNEFDMCRVGDLKDPKTQVPIRKRMTVCSTSTDMHVALHGKLCAGEHHHRPIAGSTQVDGHSVKLSQWTELYPQKFARQVAKILINDSSRYQPSYVEESDEHPTKKRRLGGKMSPQAIEARFGSNETSAGVDWPQVMQLADRTAPRVGTHVVDAGELIQVAQQLCPHNKIHHIVLCRGTDRQVGPNRSMLPGLAPMRRQICIRRHSTEIHVDDWEKWENLSHRKLRRSATPARVSMTIFAAATPPDAVPNVPPDTQDTPADASNPRCRRPHESLENSLGDDRTCKRVRTNMPDNMPHDHDPMEHNPNNNISSHHELSNAKIEFPDTQDTEAHQPPQQVIDLASQKHGPLFMQLSKEEQAWLLKLHRNLGHPGSAKLLEFCKQLQCPEQLQKAIGDLRCSTCQELKGPTIARPSAIHEPCDFGDVVSMDGVVWTNSQGDKFFFYHFLDQSTMFQTAMVTPSHTTEQACRALLMGWFNWAGPPGLLCVDAGTELNSDEFGQFLQKHNVKSRTCAAEAHWQNARTERHGGILQVMLNKIDAEQPITNYDQLASALSHATGTKNQWSRHHGYPPELLVFGKGIRVPGSVTSDPSMSAHAMAISNAPEGIRFRQDLAVREAARKAFAAVDNDQTMRRAIVQRSRPHRGFFEKGEWVMMWKRKGETDGDWVGPMQVIIQESQNVVWVTRQHKLYRVAPEHVRTLSAMEEFRNTPEMNNHQSQSPSTVVPATGGVQFHDQIAIDQNPTNNLNRHNNQNNPTHEGQTDGRSHESTETGAIPSSTIEQVPVDGRSSAHDQPDDEPEIPSSPSESPLERVDEVKDQNQLAIETPVPVSSDEESLYVEEESCYHLQENQVYQFEVNVNQRDIDHWREETRPHEMAFLVSAAKRQRSEVKISNLNAADRKLFDEAKNKEINSWLATETVTRILRHQVPQENVMRCRWILTWKDVDSASPPGSNTVSNDAAPKVPARQVPKARLVVLGFEDPMVDQIPRDSPTMSKLSRVLIMQHAASMHWDIHSFDIKTAFLRGTEESSRVLGMEPPPEMREKLRLKQNEIVRLLKGAYGRVDAPFL